MRIMRLGRFVLTIWWWRQADKRQKHPTTGIGFIIERTGLRR